MILVDLSVCVWALYSTLANLNDVSLRLFKIATDLNEIKGKNKAVQRLSGRGGQRFFWIWCYSSCLSRDGRQDSHVKAFLSFSPGSFSLDFSPAFFFSLYLCCLPVCALDRKSIGGAGLGA